MKIKRGIVAILSIFMVLACTACSGGLQPDTEVTEPQDAETQQGDVTVSQEPTESETIEMPESNEGKVLIAYFSRTGENYNVGVIEKGNTQIVADMIAEETGGDIFEIRTVTPYPDDYDACTEMAKQDQDENARLELAESVEDIESYDVVFLGFPIWWGDMPMAVYTFLESYDFSGKTIVPFCTHEGSGLSSTESSIANSCPDAEVLAGLAVRGSVAQDSQDEAKEAVVSWLGEMESEGLLSLGHRLSCRGGAPRQRRVSVYHDGGRYCNYSGVIGQRNNQSVS